MRPVWSLIVAPHTSHLALPLQVPIRGFEKNVGKKTTFRMLNSLWSTRYAMGKDFIHTGHNCEVTAYDKYVPTRGPFQRSLALS